METGGYEGVPYLGPESNSATQIIGTAALSVG